ncbi:TMEM143 family protein [Neptunomonas concharum]|uniref:DUF3754 domain-containing protein n=1 Tax=Neptunomonas concharum TaxID=1031538 RepID=A0A5P1RBF5_9GAMM|nr:TMEM143 family protein [Neptunomonas concharum]QEQ96616.1 DUF3754 domain-containing protein [Neptunomonas concharum]
MSSQKIEPLRFIPFRKSDVVEMCLAKGGLDKAQRQQFRALYRLIERHFHLEFHERVESLKDSFAHINPDADTLKVDLPSTLPIDCEPFATQLSSLLEKANFERIDEQTLQLALSRDSLFKVRLAVDMHDFADVLLYARGKQEREETLSTLFGLRKQTIRFINYERVAIYIRLNEHLDIDRQKQFNLQPGGIVLKLFKNVPEADLEMLFPNTEIRMRLIDKVLIGVPAAISGGIVISTKLGGTLLLLASLFGFWLGLHNQPVELDKAALIALFAGFGALGSYLWKQFNTFKNRKLKFVQSLTQNLYFKNLDNNAGVFHRLIDDAEEEECKEAILAYYFLLTSERKLTKPELDGLIEQWFKEKWRCTINFEIEDALHKLKKLGLVQENHDGYLTATALEQAESQVRSSGL